MRERQPVHRARNFTFTMTLFRMMRVKSFGPHVLCSRRTLFLSHVCAVAFGALLLLHTRLLPTRSHYHCEDPATGEIFVLFHLKQHPAASLENANKERFDLLPVTILENVPNPVHFQKL